MKYSTNADIICPSFSFRKLFPYKLIFIFVILFSSVTLSSKEISKGKVMLKSLILPGWGELSIGNKSGYAFLATEFMFWSTKLYFDQESDLRDRESYNHAVEFGHIERNNYDEQFYSDMTRYISSDKYNQDVVYARALLLYPDDREKRDQFIEDNSYDQQHYWNWDSKTRQGEFRKLRNEKLDYSELSKVMIGTLVANRVFSVINSLRISSKLNRMQLSMDYDKKLTPYLKVSVALD